MTVRFVDIRGYTGFSEPREAEETFNTVNRYTETVSTLVQARGGVIVEFHVTACWPSSAPPRTCR